jgi:hypothetical protein
MITDVRDRGEKIEAAMPSPRVAMKSYFRKLISLFKALATLS